ncbi:MAG TPA: cell division protein FtsZ [Bacteroidia bacterium]|nr:cell division protein FtsZ [Bacteroidia bacterium]
MNFDLPRESGSSIIKVIGVGGGGCNAVDHMYRQGIKGVDFIVCNTDQQALDKSPVPTKIILGATLTEGLGAGSNPEVGKNSAIETIDEIRGFLDKKTKMIFITAGMGGGTGTGAAPVIASVAKEMGILTVAIVTIPFGFEGKRRKTQADDGIEELKKNVDTLLIICNDKLREIYGNLKMTDAFGHADNILTTGAKGIAEIITEKLHVNTDFADIQTVLKDSGVAIMGSAEASGENRAISAVEKALNSPLLNDSNIKGARHVLLNVKCGSGDNEISMDEFGEITDYLQDAAGGTAEVIQGYGIDETLDNSVIVTIIATGFNNKKDIGVETIKAPVKKVTPLYDNVQQPAAQTHISSTNEVKMEEKKVFELDVEIPTKEESFIYSPVEFSINKHNEENLVNEVVFEDEIQISNHVELQPEKESSSEDMMKKSNERKERLKNFSWKMGKSINDLEGTPAYIRKNVQLDNVPHSSDSQVSRYTLSEGEDKKAEIKPNNSFLHDNVD